MKYFKYSFPLFVLLSLFLFPGFKPINTPVKSLDERVDSVMNLMTMEEKIGQLNQLSFGIGFGPTVKSQVPDEYKEMIRKGHIGSFLNAVGAEFTRDLQSVAVNETRLKIPLIFGFDVIHGFKTTFPVPLAEASSWDPEIVELSAKCQALEASSAGVNWTFAPMVDIAREPRWGRIVEGSGEDPYLGSVMSAARVKGFQGDLSKYHIYACAKHYAAYGGAEGGRDYNTVDMSERTLREIYLPPFKAALDAGVETFMASFNEIGGVPSSGSGFLMNTILRDEWKFDGFVVSDWNSVGELIPHGVAEDLKQAAEIGLNAGCDMDMESRAYTTHLAELVKEGKVSEETINKSVRRILKAKFKLGLFDDPYKYCDKKREEETILNKDMQDAALKVSQRSIVLLKNDNTLPLKKDLKTLAVIGPLADSKADPLGAWAQFGDPADVVSALSGIKAEVSGNTKVLYAKGCPVDTVNRDGFNEAVETAKKADAVILVIGEYFSMSGEARSRSSLELPGVQEELAKKIIETGKPVVIVLMNGRPLAIPWLSENANAVVESWFLGIKCGNALADVLFGDYNPSGKMPVTVPRATGQIPVYYNHKNSGRPASQGNYFTSRYLDLDVAPLYPFGYGLSYTKFTYGKMKLSSDKMDKNGSIKVSVDVTNSGNYDGEEVVQLYTRDLVGSVTRPVKELKAFDKIFLKKGETKTVTFNITNDKLKFYTDKMEFASEPGKFKVFVGTNSADVQEADFELTAN
jgi:beta-glucosidase